MMKLLIFSLVVSLGLAFSPTIKTVQKTTMLEMVNRREAIVAGAAAILASAGPAAFALGTFPADNEIVKEQRTVTGKLDVNNSAVADYMQYQGLYPTIAGKIANNGPYKSVKDVYKILSKSEQSKLKEYSAELVATPATGLDVMRGRDPNRTSFNAFKKIKRE